MQELPKVKMFAGLNDEDLSTIQWVGEERTIEADAVGPVARKTSDRVITNFTGRPPAFRERARERASEKIVVFPPKPPPISDGVTRS